MRDRRFKNLTSCAGTVFAAVLVMFAAVAAFGQEGVDLTFNASPASDSGLTLESGKAVPEPDGKMITLVRYPNSTGGTTSAVNRVNADGSIDYSFNCTTCTWSIYSIGRQPDGKILIAGVGPNKNARILRLNTDGSADFTFISPYEQIPSFSSSAQIYAVAPDGKIYVSRHFVGFHMSNKVLQRLNINGSIDGTFTESYYETWGTNFRLTRVEISPGGKLLITGKHGTYGRIFRLNNDGTKDNTFDAPALSAPTNPDFPQLSMEPTALAGVQQADGKLVFTGAFDHVNAIPRVSLARLNTDSSLDSATTNLPFIGPSNVDIRGQTDGKMVVSGGAASGEPFQRINADLTVDNTFGGSPAFAEVAFWTLDGADRVVYFGNGTFHRLNIDGMPDATFNFGVRTPGTVTALAAQNDGKTIVAGNFGFMGSAPRSGFAQVNADGSNDPSFDPGTGFDVAPNSLLVQADGKILACGTFTLYNGTPAGPVARINADGTLDSAFAPALSGVGVIALQADGKILLGGGNITANGLSRTGVARLNADGTTDAAFNPLIGSPTMLALIPQDDGKIAIGGIFSGVNGFSRSNFARLNSDGSLDPSLNAGSIGFPVKALRQPDGKYLLAGSTVIRRNADGSADGTFVSPSFSGGSINTMLLDSAGRVVIGGFFESPRSRIARLSATGALDTTFVASGANAGVWSLVKQADGKIIAGGSFTSIGGVTRAGIARFTAVALAARTPFDFDGDGRADVSLTQSGDFMWRQLLGVNNTPNSVQFGLAGDKITPADYDGDGRTDIGVFDPPSGWWFKSSVNGQTYCVPFGTAGDIPMPGDMDGDGKADFVIVRNYVWYALNLSGTMIMTMNFGQAGDKPITGDFDGDGKTDPAVYRPSTGEFIYATHGAHAVIRWGSPDDIPVPADYDGDGKTDAAVFRPSDGYWWVLFSRNMRYRGVPFGLGTDKPVPADYDGDGMADISVFRPSDGNWYFLKTAEGYTGLHFGTSTDIPSQGAYIPPAASLTRSGPNAPPRPEIVKDASGREAVKRR